MRFSHFIAKLVTRLEALGSASMRLTCFSIAPGRGQSIRRRERQQFLVRAGVPEEEGEPGGEFQIGESELRVGRHALGPADAAIQKLRADQHRRHDLLDSLVERSAVYGVPLHRTA